MNLALELFTASASKLIVGGIKRELLNVLIFIFTFLFEHKDKKVVKFEA